MTDPPPSGPPDELPGGQGDAQVELAAAGSAQFPLESLPPPPPGAMPHPSGGAPPPPGWIPPSGTNGLAIAALCCGIFGFFLVSAILALVFGIIALNQLRYQPRKGRGLAIGGLVLGSLWIAGLAALVVVGLVTGPERGADGQVTSQGQTVLDNLREGDCFDGVGADLASWDGRGSVTVKPCDTSHEAQVGARLTLPDGTFPGLDKVGDLAMKACTDTLEPMMRDEAFDQLDLVVFYPNSAFSWRMDRSAICVLVALQDTTTGSALI